MNHEGFDRRMDVVRDILRDHGLEGTEITPVEYIQNCPFPFNNFIFKVVLASPATAASFGGEQPCTVTPPAGGVSTLIVRLSNPRAMGMNNTNRVENEVAAMHLARHAIAQLGDHYVGLVPALYAWKAGVSADQEAGFGWTVMEYMPGLPMDAQFEAFSLDEKKRLVGEVAAIFAALQGVKLPPGLDRHGGLTIDKQGAIVSGQSTLQEGEPWTKYEDHWVANLELKLKEADESAVVQGWRENGVRERVDRFVATKVGEAIREAGVDTSQLALVHTDFTMNNMLFDPETKRITALLDFDWAAVTHPANEFFTSLHDVKGSTRVTDTENLQRAILTGRFDGGGGADDGAEHREAWELAGAWDAALRRLGATRPSDVRGIETLEKLRGLASLLAPFHLVTDVVVKRRTAEQIAEARAENEAAIVKALEEFGV